MPPGFKTVDTDNGIDEDTLLVGPVAVINPVIYGTIKLIPAGKSEPP